MELFTVLAGDFEKGAVGGVVSNWKGRALQFFVGKEKVSFYSIASLEAVNEEDAKSYTSAAGWGLAGGLAFGPLGGLAGRVLGGRSKEVVFALVLRDGRRLMAKGPGSVFPAMKAGFFAAPKPVSRESHPPPAPDLSTKVCPFCAETIKAAAVLCRYCGKDVPPLQICDVERAVAQRFFENSLYESELEEDLRRIYHSEEEVEAAKQRILAMKGTFAT